MAYYYRGQSKFINVNGTRDLYGACKDWEIAANFGVERAVKKLKENCY